MNAEPLIVIFVIAAIGVWGLIHAQNASDGDDDGAAF